MAKRHLTRRRMLAATGAAAATALAGCADDSGGQTGDGGGDGDGDGGTPQGDAEILVGAEGGAHFDPQSVTISTGQTVVWSSQSADHQIVAEDTPDESDWSGMAGQILGPDQNYSHTFEVAGTYTYRCVYHSGAEHGEIVVE